MPIKFYSFSRLTASSHYNFWPSDILNKNKKNLCITFEEFCISRRVWVNFESQSSRFFFVFNFQNFFLTERKDEARVQDISWKRSNVQLEEK